MTGIHSVNAKRDANEQTVVAILKDAGCLVERISGAGVPDLLVLHPTAGLILVEVKDGSKPPSKRKLTPMQADFHILWHKAPIFVVSTDAEARALLIRLSRIDSVAAT